MEKRFLKLSEELIVMFLSGMVILFSFFYDNDMPGNIISFLLKFIKSSIFFSVPFLLFVLEKRRENIKKVAAIYSSYFAINLLITLFFSFNNTIIIVFVKIIYDLVNLLILLSGLFIFVDYFLRYNSISSKVYYFSIMKIVYLIGETFSYPFVYFINKKISKGEK